ncbi:MAG: MFS transporter [Eubacteriaceae bacterium]|jgi:OFA family oxalate/formate antiporter-like MFS transporter|nr:MFS transporter [Eubacteriaceae bacterium]
MRRWVYLIFAAAAMMFMGLVEGWTIFILPLEHKFPGWSLTQLSVTLSLTELGFAAGGFICAYLRKKYTPRMIMIFAAFMMFIGWFGLSHLDTTDPGMSIIMLWILYGAVNGVAIGIGYMISVSVISMWFQERQGFASGVLIMLYGLGSLIIGSAASALMGRYGLFRTFAIIAVCETLVLFICSFAMIPPDNKAMEAKINPNASGDRLTPQEMLRRPDFWIFFIWQVVIDSAGFLAINCASPMAAAYGAPAVLGLTIALGNCASRFLMGVVFDRFGRKSVMLCSVVCMAAAAAVFIIGDSAKSLPLIIAGLIVTGLAYGGQPCIASAFVNAQYGQDHFTINLSLMYCTIIPAAFLGPLISARLIENANGGYRSTFIMLAVISAVAAVLLFCMEAYMKKGRSK